MSRFETADTAARSKSDAELREDLLRKLIDRQLLGPTQELLLEGDISRLPARELPPGNTSSLFMMYLAFMRTSGDGSPCGKSTFFEVAKCWRPALRFRRKSDHAICFECTTLKNKIRLRKDS